MHIIRPHLMLVSVVIYASLLNKNREQDYLLACRLHYLLLLASRKCIFLHRVFPIS